MLSEKEMDSLLACIPEASSEQIHQLLEEIRLWYRKNFPSWEMTYLSLPLEDMTQRKQILNTALDTLCKVPDAENGK